MWSSFFSNSFLKYFFRRKGKAYIIRTCLAYFDPNTTELLHFPWHYICVPSWVYHIFQNCLFRPPIKIAFVVLLDFSKAFDSLDLSRLLAKLKTLRVGCTALELFGSYLSGRQQYGRIGAEASSLGAIYNGVSQGSILGQGLFTIFINDPSTDPEIWFSGIIRWWFKTLFVIFLSKILAVWSSKLMMIYRKLRLGATVIVFWSTQTRPSWLCWEPDKCYSDYLQTFTSLYLEGKFL